MTTQIRDGKTLDALLDELTDLASTAPMSGPFFLAILDVALRTTNAHAGAIWSVVGVKYRLEQEVGLVRLGIGTDPHLQKLHEEALECESTGPIATIPARAESELTERSHEGNRYRFFGCRDRNLAYLVIELVHEENALVPTDPGLVGRIMAALSEIARDFRNAQTLQRLQSEDDIWNDFKAILPQLHSSIQLEESAHCLANEGRKFLQCDRLSVAVVDKNKATLVAVSGVSTIERRAKQVRELESLVALVARSGSSLRYPSTEMEAPQLAEGLQRYLDESQDERIWISLMFREPSATDSSQTASQRCIGALVVESFDVTETPELALRSELLLQHGGIAIQNALEFDRLPLKRLSQALSRWPKTYQAFRVKGLIGLVGLFCLTLAVVIPADLNMHANGTIQPLAMHHVYAPANGEVVQIHASHQSQVQTGDLLVEIRSREMELRKEELLTQRATTQEKLRGIEVARLRDRKQTNAESASIGELSASERELREVLASQDAQLAILGEMLASLQLKSPVSGHVISWDPAESLERRPVQQGQKLLSVAELDGAGRLQLRVLDEDTRHVINASKRINASNREKEPIHVTFSIASDPGIRHSAVVNQIGTMIETVTEDGATLRIDAVVAAADMQNVRPGATVNAKIHCGKASIGYVWTRRLWDFLLFRLF